MNEYKETQQQQHTTEFDGFLSQQWYKRKRKKLQEQHTFTLTHLHTQWARQSKSNRHPNQIHSIKYQPTCSFSCMFFPINSGLVCTTKNSFEKWFPHFLSPIIVWQTDEAAQKAQKTKSNSTQEKIQQTWMSHQKQSHEQSFSWMSSGPSEEFAHTKIKRLKCVFWKNK